VVVLRGMRNKRNLLVAWIDNAVHETRPNQELSAGDRDRLNEQKVIMRLFDSLILNTDRETGDWLFSRSGASAIAFFFACGSGALPWLRSF
jgi:hypothetical protein